MAVGNLGGNSQNWKATCVWGVFLNILKIAAMTFNDLY